MFFSFLHVRIKGEEFLPEYPDSPAVFVINHASSLDIFLMEYITNYPHIWLSKSFYTKIPLFSILLNRMHVPVKRLDPSSAGPAFLKAYRQAKNISSHIFIFPEGTRSKDGRIQQFHPGFALLAKKLNRPVIPIKIYGFHKIFPKGKILIDYKAVKPTVTIGRPIFINKDESREQFTERVREWFIN